jgi:hypothetical protein
MGPIYNVVELTSGPGSLGDRYGTTVPAEQPVGMGDDPAS